MRIRCIMTILVALLFVLPAMAGRQPVKTAPQTNPTENAAPPQGDNNDNKSFETAQPETATGNAAETNPNSDAGNSLSDQQSKIGDFHGIQPQSDEDGNVKSQGEVSNETYEQSSDEESAGMNWLSTLLALVALGISGYVLYTSHGNKKPGNKSAAMSGNNLSPESRNVLQQTQKISLALTSLTQRIDDLERKVDALSASQQVNSGQYSGRNIDSGRGGSVSHPSAMQRYTSMVTSDGFPVDNLMDANGDYVIAILTLTGDTGTYVVNNLPSAQQFLISNFAYSVGRICEVKQQNEAATRVETINPGKISRQGNSWKIISKAEVRLV